MRICVSGTCSQGKSSYIDGFLKNWTEYSTPKKTYRSWLKGNHSKKTTKDVQWRILNDMVDEMQKHSTGDKVIYDRGPLDNIALTIWAGSKGIKDIDADFINKCISIVRESFKFLDIIFMVPITNAAEPVKYDTDDFKADKKKGLVDEQFRQEVDFLLKGLKYDWEHNSQSKFFDHEDKPAIIEVFGTLEQRLQITKLYLDDKGELIGGDFAADMFTEDDIRQTEMLKEQFGISDTQSEVYKNKGKIT